MPIHEPWKLALIILGLVAVLIFMRWTGRNKK